MCGYRYADGRRVPSKTASGDFRTGDIGVIEEDGLVRVVGRKKEIIIRAGTNIVPEAIDAVLRKHPAVAECKTVGVSDDLIGERVITAWVPAPGAHPSQKELRRFLAERVSQEFLPDHIQTVARLPRTAVGKIALADLRKLVSGVTAREAFAAINKQKFKRAQPRDADSIVRAFQARLLADMPLGFLSYWGVGTRSELAQVDLDALARLSELIDAARSVSGVDAVFDVLLAEVHPELNGKPRDRIARYHSAIRRECDRLGFRCVSEAEIWESAGLDVDEILAEAEVTSAASLCEQMGIGEEPLDRLRSASRRHAEGVDPELALRAYLLACAREREVVSKRFAGSILFTSSPPSFSFLNPNLPTMFIFSYRHGSTEKPWFVDELTDRGPLAPGAAASGSPTGESTLCR
jgi:hypothetical protein